MDKATGNKVYTVNEFDDGLVRKYYPDTQNKLSIEAFVYDSSSNCIGIRTTYYKQDGSVSYIYDENGNKNSTYAGWGSSRVYKSDNITDSSFANADVTLTPNAYMCVYEANNGVNEDYNGKVYVGSSPLNNSTLPTSVTLYTGYIISQTCYAKQSTKYYYDANGQKQFFVNYFRRYTHYINGVYDASGSGFIEAQEIVI